MSNRIFSLTWLIMAMFWAVLLYCSNRVWGMALCTFCILVCGNQAIKDWQSEGKVVPDE